MLRVRVGAMGFYEERKKNGYFGVCGKPELLEALLVILGDG